MLRRYLQHDGHWKAVAVNTTAIAREAFQRLQPSPHSLQLVVQAMTGALLLTPMLKSAGTLSLKFEGDGPLGHLTAEADSQGKTRAFCGDLNWSGELAEGNMLFQQALGAGRLTVRSRLARSAHHHSSVVDLIAGELAANLAHYLLQSDQVSSAISLGTLLCPERGVHGAGGILIQALPGARPEELAVLEERLVALPPIGVLFGEQDFTALEKILFEGLGFDLLHEQEVAWFCKCTRQLVLSLLSHMERQELLSDPQGITVQCSYCAKPYHFTQKELQELQQND